MGASLSISDVEEKLARTSEKSVGGRVVSALSLMLINRTRLPPNKSAGTFARSLLLRSMVSAKRLLNAPGVNCRMPLPEKSLQKRYLFVSQMQERAINQSHGRYTQVIPQRSRSVLPVICITWTPRGICLCIERYNKVQPPCYVARALKGRGRGEAPEVYPHIQTS